MSVLPEHHWSRVGSALIWEGLTQLRNAGHGLVIVLGHPEYYPRSGFEPASNHGIYGPFEVSDEAYMAIELREKAATTGGGVMRYHKAFESV